MKKVDIKIHQNFSTCFALRNYINRPSKILNIIIKMYTGDNKLKTVKQTFDRVDQFSDFLHCLYSLQNQIPKVINSEKIPVQVLDRHFVKIHLQQSTQKSQNKRIKIENIFQGWQSFEQQKNKIIISGDAGSGKSTLINYIAYNWGKQNLQNYPFDYVVKLKFSKLLAGDAKINSLKTFIVESIYDQLSEIKRRFNAKSEQQKKAELVLSQQQKRQGQRKTWASEVQYLENFYRKSNMSSEVQAILNQEQTLFLIDGYDEIAHLDMKIRSGDHPVKKIINDIYGQQNSYVIMTSQSNSITNTLQEQFDRQIQIMDLSPKSIQIYIDKFFQNLNAKEMWSKQGTKSKGKQTTQQNSKQEAIDVKNIKQTLKGMFIKNVCLNQLIKNPLNLALVCIISINLIKWNDQTKDFLIHQLYEQVIFWMVNKFIETKQEKQAKYNLEALEGLTTASMFQDIPQLDALKQLAYDAFLNNTTVISGAEIKKMVRFKRKEIKQASDVTQLGLLKLTGKQALKQKPKQINLKPEQLLLKGSRLEKTNFQLLHLSFQEFLTARKLMELLSSSNRSQKQAAIELIGKNKYDLRYSRILQFLAGMTFKRQDDDGRVSFDNFWQSILQNVDGYVDVGRQNKTKLLIRLLPEIIDEKNQLTADFPYPKKIQQFLKDSICNEKFGGIPRWTSEIVQNQFLTKELLEQISKITHLRLTPNLQLEFDEQEKIEFNPSLCSSLQIVSSQITKFDQSTKMKLARYVFQRIYKNASTFGVNKIQVEKFSLDIVQKIITNLTETQIKTFILNVRQQMLKRLHVNSFEIHSDVLRVLFSIFKKFESMKDKEQLYHKLINQWEKNMQKQKLKQKNIRKQQNPQASQPSQSTEKIKSISQFANINTRILKKFLVFFRRFNERTVEQLQLAKSTKQEQEPERKKSKSKGKKSQESAKYQQLQKQAQKMKTFYSGFGKKIQETSLKYIENEFESILACMDSIIKKSTESIMNPHQESVIQLAQVQKIEDFVQLKDRLTLFNSFCTALGETTIKKSQQLQKTNITLRLMQKFSQLQVSESGDIVTQQLGDKNVKKYLLLFKYILQTFKSILISSDITKSALVDKLLIFLNRKQEKYREIQQNSEQILKSIILTRTVEDQAEHRDVQTAYFRRLLMGYTKGPILEKKQIIFLNLIQHFNQNDKDFKNIKFFMKSALLNPYILTSQIKQQLYRFRRKLKDNTKTNRHKKQIVLLLEKIQYQKQEEPFLVLKLKSGNPQEILSAVIRINQMYSDYKYQPKKQILSLYEGFLDKDWNQITQKVLQLIKYRFNNDGTYQDKDKINMKTKISKIIANHLAFGILTFKRPPLSKVALETMFAICETKIASIPQNEVSLAYKPQLQKFLNNSNQLIIDKNLLHKEEVFCIMSLMVQKDKKLGKDKDDYEKCITSIIQVIKKQKSLSIRLSAIILLNSIGTKKLKDKNNQKDLKAKAKIQSSIEKIYNQATIKEINKTIVQQLKTPTDNYSTVLNAIENLCQKQQKTILENQVLYTLLDLAKQKTSNFMQQLEESDLKDQQTQFDTSSLPFKQIEISNNTFDGFEQLDFDLLFQKVLQIIQQIKLYENKIKRDMRTFVFKTFQLFSNLISSSVALRVDERISQIVRLLQSTNQIFFGQTANLLMTIFYKHPQIITSNVVAKLLKLYQSFKFKTSQQNERKSQQIHENEEDEFLVYLRPWERDYDSDMFFKYIEVFLRINNSQRIDQVVNWTKYRPLTDIKNICLKFLVILRKRPQNLKSYYTQSIRYLIYERKPEYVRFGLSLLSRFMDKFLDIQSKQLFKNISITTLLKQKNSIQTLQIATKFIQKQPFEETYQIIRLIIGYLASQVSQDGFSPKFSQQIRLKAFLSLRKILLNLKMWRNQIDSQNNMLNSSNRIFIEDILEEVVKLTNKNRFIPAYIKQLKQFVKFIIFNFKQKFDAFMMNDYNFKAISTIIDIQTIQQEKLEFQYNVDKQYELSDKQPLWRLKVDDVSLFARCQKILDEGEVHSKILKMLEKKQFLDNLSYRDVPLLIYLSNHSPDLKFSISKLFTQVLPTIVGNIFGKEITEQKQIQDEYSVSSPIFIKLESVDKLFQSLDSKYQQMIISKITSQIKNYLFLKRKLQSQQSDDMQVPIYEILPSQNNIAIEYLEMVASKTLADQAISKTDFQLISSCINVNVDMTITRQNKVIVAGITYPISSGRHYLEQILQKSYEYADSKDLYKKQYITNTPYFQNASSIKIAACDLSSVSSIFKEENMVTLDEMILTFTKEKTKKKVQKKQKKKSIESGKQLQMQNKNTKNKKDNKNDEQDQQNDDGLMSIITCFVQRRNYFGDYIIHKFYDAQCIYQSYPYILQQIPELESDDLIKQKELINKKIHKFRSEVLGALKKDTEEIKYTVYSQKISKDQFKKIRQKFSNGLLSQQHDIRPDQLVQNIASCQNLTISSLWGKSEKTAKKKKWQVLGYTRDSNLVSMVKIESLQTRFDEEKQRVRLKFLKIKNILTVAGSTNEQYIYEELNKFQAISKDLAIYFKVFYYSFSSYIYAYDVSSTGMVQTDTAFELKTKENLFISVLKKGANVAADLLSSVPIFGGALSHLGDFVEKVCEKVLEYKFTNKSNAILNYFKESTSNKNQRDLQIRKTIILIMQHKFNLKSNPAKDQVDHMFDQKQEGKFNRLIDTLSDISNQMGSKLIQVKINQYGDGSKGSKLALKHFLFLVSSMHNAACQEAQAELQQQEKRRLIEKKQNKKRKTGEQTQLSTSKIPQVKIVPVSESQQQIGTSDNILLKDELDIDTDSKQKKSTQNPNNKPQQTLKVQPQKQKNDKTSNEGKDFSQTRSQTDQLKRKDQQLNKLSERLFQLFKKAELDQQKNKSKNMSKQFKCGCQSCKCQIF